MNKMTPKGQPQLPPRKQFIADYVRDYDTPRAEAKAQYARLLKQELWENDKYVVLVDKHPPHGFAMDVWHLSIRRQDRAPIHDWRDLQKIKNEIVGEQVEAIEIYPAEDRLVDTANQYHLWAFPQGQAVPVGYVTRLVDGESKHGAVQRPFA